jgi:hypothetical protein
VREAAEAVERHRQLPLFAGPNGSGRLLATARGALDEILVGLREP